MLLLLLLLFIIVLKSVVFVYLISAASQSSSHSLNLIHCLQTCLKFKKFFTNFSDVKRQIVIEGL